MSDTSSVGANTLNPADKVFQWLWHPRNYVASSGYDSISVTSSSHHSKMEGIVYDLPMVQNNPRDMDTPKYVRNMTEQKRPRTFSM